MSRSPMPTIQSQPQRCNNRQLLHVRLEQACGEMRTAPDALASVVRQLSRSEAFLIIETVKSGSGEWVRIRLSDGREGYLDGKSKIQRIEAKAGAKVGNTAEHDTVVGG